MAEHWDRFWTSDSRSGSGCLPERNPAERAQRQIWHEFAQSLPRGARILDLGTGDGRVMGWLLERRRDLKPTGVDSARQLPAPPQGSRVRAGVSIEQVPLPDASFDAVTSQFGFEYGDIEATAPELVRLLRRQGRFRLLVHHASGPIVRHNLARAVANMPTPASFRELVAQAGSRFGVGSGAEEFTLALFQTLEASRGGPPQRVLSTLAELEQAAADEIARIGALANAAADTAKIDKIVALLNESGASVDPVWEVSDRESAPPFAWLVDGVKA